MKRILLLLSVALTLAAPVWAQDVVYRKADGPLNCMVTGTDGGMVRVLVAGQKVSLPMADVDSIALDARVGAAEDKRLSRPGLSARHMVFSTGLYAVAGFFVNAGLELRAGWKPTPRTTLGLGVNFSHMDTRPFEDDWLLNPDDTDDPDYEYADVAKESDYTAWPVYLYVRHDFLRRVASPFVEITSGIVPETNVDKVGYIGGCDVGIRVALRHLSLMYYMGGMFFNGHCNYNPSHHMHSRGAFATGFMVEW